MSEQLSHYFNEVKLSPKCCWSISEATQINLSKFKMILPHEEPVLVFIIMQDIKNAVHFKESSSLLKASQQYGPKAKAILSYMHRSLVTSNLQITCRNGYRRLGYLAPQAIAV